MIASGFKQHIKHLLAAGIVGGFLLLLANLLVNNPYSQKIIRATVLEKLREHTYLDFSFEAFSLSILPLKAELYGVRLEAQSSYKVPPLLAASRLILRGSWLSLLMGKPRLKTLEVHDVDVIWPPPWDFKGFLREDQQAGPAKAPQSRNSGEWLPDDFPVDDIEIRHARLYAEVPVEDELPLAASYLAIKVGEGDFNLHYDGWKRAFLDVDIRTSTLLADDDVLLNEAALQGRLRVVGDKVVGDDFQLSSNESQMRLKIELNPESHNVSKELMGLELGVIGAGHADLTILGAFLEIEDTHGRIDGNVEVRAHISLSEQRQSSFLITGQGQANDGYIDNFRLHNTRTSFSIDDERISFNDMALIIDEREVATGSGHIGLNDKVPFYFSVAPEGLSLSALLGSLNANFDVFDLQMNSQNLVVEGMGEPFKMTATADALFTDISIPKLNIEKTRFLVSPRCDVNLALDINSDRLHFTNARANCRGVEGGDAAAARHSLIKASGDIFFDDAAGVQMQAESEAFQLPLLAYFTQVPWSGQAKFRSTIAGEHAAVQVKTSFSGADLSVAGMPLASFKGEATVLGDEVSWSGVQAIVRSGSELVSPKGRYDIVRDYWQSEWQITALDAEWVKSFFTALPGKPDLSFAVNSWTGAAEGYFLQPASYRGTSQFAVRDLRYAGETLADRAEGQLLADREVLHAEPLNLWLGNLRHSWKLSVERARYAYGPGAAQGASWWSALGFQAEDKVSMSVRTFQEPQAAGDASKAYLQRLPFIAPYLAKVNLHGSIKLEGKLSGNFRGLQGSLAGSLEDISLWDAGLAPIYFKGFVDHARLDLTLQHAGGALAGRMSSDFSKTGVPFEWYLNFAQLDLRAFGSQYFYKDPRNYAYLSGSWSLKGHYSDWWRAVGTMQLTSVRAKYHLDVSGRTQSLDVRNKEPVTVLFRRDGWSLAGNKPLVLEGDNLGGTISLLPSRPPENLHLQAEGKVKLAVLARMSQDIESATGQLGFRADLQGPVEDLDLEARLSDVKESDLPAGEWEEVSLGFTELRPEFKAASLDLSYRDGLVSIHHLSARKGTGTVRAQGRFNVFEGEGEEASNNVNVVFDQIKMIYPIPYLKSFDTTLSGELQLTGQKRPYLLSGDVKVVKARSTRKFDVRNEVVKAMRQESIDNAARRADKLAFLRFNVNINADQSITINNESMQLWISSVLQLQGTEQNPILLGNVDLDKGKFFYKREFEVQRGEIIFDNQLKINPRLDILAIAQVDAYQVTVAVLGEASKPTVEFLVDPATRDDGSVITNLDAIVLLSTGSLPPSGKESLELRGTALSEVLNYAGQVPFEKLTETLGQKYIHVYPEFITDDTGSPTIQINVPVRITNNVEMVIKRTPNKSKAAVEVPIHDSITVSGSVEQGSAEETATKEKTGQGSVDLRFRFSFK